MQYKTATTHGILVPPQSPQKESSCAPQGLLLERVHPGTDKHDWNNQCFSILKTLYPKHRSRGGQASAAGQPRALPVPQPAVPTETHTGKPCWKHICNNACTPSLLSPTFPRASIKRGGGSMNSCASQSFTIL